MKRLLKFFAFLGGLGAVGWLVRHRFVGMTLNREPQTPEPAPEPRTPQTAEAPQTSEDETPEATPEAQTPESANAAPPAPDLTSVLEVSPEDAERLDSAGISTIAQLAIADADDLAEKTGLDKDRLSSWMEKAAALV